MTAPTPDRCRHCGRPITPCLFRSQYGCRHARGWFHDDDSAHECDPELAAALAEPKAPIHA